MNNSVLSLTTICRSQMLKGYSLVDEVPTSIQMQHDEAWKVWPFHLQSLIWEMCVSSSPVQLCTSLLMWAPWLNLAQPAPVSHRNKLRNICACVHSKLLKLIRLFQTVQNLQKQPHGSVGDGFLSTGYTHSLISPRPLKTASIEHVQSFFPFVWADVVAQYQDRPLVVTKDMLAQNRAGQE